MRTALVGLDLTTWAIGGLGRGFSESDFVSACTGLDAGESERVVFEEAASYRMSQCIILGMYDLNQEALTLSGNVIAFQA